jgi:hypothetical protein
MPTFLFLRSLCRLGPVVADAPLRYRLSRRLPVVRFESSRSLRRAYLDWVEDQLETFKETVPRSDLLRIADEVIAELRITDAGQYQWTELLLCTAVDRRIFRMLGLPGYQAWCRARRAALRERSPELPAVGVVSDRHATALMVTHPVPAQTLVLAGK